MIRYLSSTNISEAPARYLHAVLVSARGREEPAQVSNRGDLERGKRKAHQCRFDLGDGHKIPIGQVEHAGRGW